MRLTSKSAPDDCLDYSSISFAQVISVSVFFAVAELRQILTKWFNFPHERHDFPFAGETGL